MTATRRFQKATIRDVAAHAGVSKTTVSAFVNGREDICSEETAQRIREAVAALHYSPNSLVSGLRSGRATRIIGVCAATSFDVGRSEPFLESLWRGIAAEADRANYSLLHYPYSVRQSDDCDAFLDGRVDGVLFKGNETDRPVKLAQAGLSSVLLNRAWEIPEGCGAVWASETNTAFLALSHLWEQGHRRIAHLSGPVVRDDHQKPAFDFGKDIALRRRDGFTAFMAARNAFDPNLLADAGAWDDNSREAAQTALEQWQALPASPTAVFCANDRLAVSLIAAARSRGMNVPRDLSVVGVDNLNWLEWQQNDGEALPLTTVEVPLVDVGREAIRTLLRLMAGASPKDCQIAVPVKKLVVRASVAVAPS